MSSTSAANLFNVDGLVAVITGGGTGIGLMMAKALEENGAKVYIIGRRLEVLQKAAKEAKHNNIIPIPGDVTKKSDLQNAVDIITKSTGYLNVLIANTGIQGPGIGGPAVGNPNPNSSLSELRKMLWATDSDAYTNAYAVNSTAAFFTVVAFLDLLAKGNEKKNVEQSSQVIATTSIAAFNRNALAGFAYGGSKAATTHLMKQFASLFIPHGIRSNIIAPGLYPSELADDAIASMTSEDGLLPMAVVPARRPGTKEDMGGLILYLTSRAGAYVNGTVLVTDGGRLGGLPSTY